MAFCMLFASNLKLRIYLGKYFCRKYNNTHSNNDRLDTFDIYFMKQYTATFEKPPSPVKKVNLWSHRCFESKSESVNLPQESKYSFNKNPASVAEERKNLSL